MRSLTTVSILALAFGALACSGGGNGGSSTGEAGSSGSSSGGGSSGGSTGGGSSGGGTTGLPTSCTIPDAGTVSKDGIDPQNSCALCDPSTSTTSWTQAPVCAACNAAGVIGLCTALGTCCTIKCDNGTGFCNLGDGGQGGACGQNSDCCGINPACP